MKNKYIGLFFGAAAMLAASSCEKEYVLERLDIAPVVTSFTPTEGYAGCEVTITGESLHNVVGATIGDVDATIAQRISDTKIVIKVPAMAPSGKIALTNAKGTGTGAADFTVTYPAPAPVLTAVPASVDLATTMMIDGQRMSVITRTLFTGADGVNKEAEVISQNDNEIIFKVPYVNGGNATLAFEYYDGSALRLTENEAAKAIYVSSFEPTVTSISATEAEVGEIITLDGTNLDKVEQVVLGGTDCPVSLQTESQLRFSVPAGDFADGTTIAALEIVYFGGVETKVLNDSFKVVVPTVYFWADRKVWAQSRQVDEFTSFFSPETGICYSNIMWRTFDAVAYANQANTCSAAQVPKVSEEEYNSVVPYFFFSGVNAGQLQINSPAGSTGQLKNFFTENNSADAYRVCEANGNCYGTAVMGYLLLDEANAAHAALINKMRTADMADFTIENYPIDTEAMTCGGIELASVANSVNDTKYAPGVFTVGEDKDTDLDAYIMVFHYTYKGLDTANKSLNIRRAGLLNIKHIDFKCESGKTSPSKSAVTFDMYWMKHNY